jgi:hypothetical protein
VPGTEVAGLPRIPHHATAGIACGGVEELASKVAAADQPLIHFISVEAVVSAESFICAAPLTTMGAPGSAGRRSYAGVGC